MITSVVVKSELATLTCLLLLILNLKYNLFSLATGVKWCGGLRLFGTPLMKPWPASQNGLPPHVNTSTGLILSFQIQPNGAPDHDLIYNQTTYDERGLLST